MSAVNALLATGALSCKMLHVSSELRALPPEPWGRRLRRVREDVRLVSGWMDQAGIKTGRYDGVSAHALRHTAASDLLDRCGNVRLVQGFLGHASLATTDRYVRPASVEQLRAALAEPA